MTQAISQPVGYRPDRPATAHWDISKVPMKSQGELEAVICKLMSRLEQQWTGRGPRDVQARLIGDLLVVRLQGVLTAVEQQLVKSVPAEKGRGLLKQVRTHLIETARPVIEAMIQEVTGVKVLSLHHDISTATGEQVVLFTLAESPVYRNRRNDAVMNRRTIVADVHNGTAKGIGGPPLNLRSAPTTH